MCPSSGCTTAHTNLLVRHLASVKKTSTVQTRRLRVVGRSARVQSVKLEIDRRRFFVDMLRRAVFVATRRMRMGEQEVDEVLGAEEKRCQRSRDSASLTHVGSHILLTAVSNTDVMMRPLAGINF